MSRYSEGGLVKGPEVLERLYQRGNMYADRPEGPWFRIVSTEEAKAIFEKWKDAMNNQTNRLAQLIATAADKELGTRADGQPRRQDKAAAVAIEAEYLFIRRSELPTAEIVDRDGASHVDVGSDAGTWSCKTASADYARTTGLEYLAASIAIQEWHDQAAERHRKERREELAGELAGGIYEQVPASLQEAIDRIIELEGKTA